jgi:hypothetical protein
MRVFILALFLGLSHQCLCQGQRQIQSRNIKEVVSTTTENKKGTLTKKTIATQYDRKGRPSSIHILDSDSLCVTRELFMYTKNGDLTSRTLLRGNSDFILEKEEIFYDRWKRDTLIVEWKDNEVKMKTSIHYDNMDNKTAEITYDNGGKLIKKSLFTYDKKGMLLEKITTDDKDQILYRKQNRYSY